jgi:hypothetical protein
MTVSQCFLDGFDRVRRSPALVSWVFLASLIIALPLTAVMREILRDSFGTSLVQEKMRLGFDLDWYGEFSSTASGLDVTFGPSIVGVLPVLGNLERIVDGEVFAVDRTVLAAGIFFLLAWAFLGGGIILRFSQAKEATTRREFFGSCGVYFFRFVRLLVVSLLIYWAVFRWVSAPVHSWVDRLTRDLTVELTAMMYTLAAYAVVGLLLMISSLSLDYAKIAMVVEGRSSALLAFIRGLRFFLAHPVQTLSLYALILLAGVLLVGAYAVIAPGPSQSGNAALILTFLVGQCYILARIFLKLWFLSGQTLLFQSAAREPAPAAMVSEVPPRTSEMAA